MSSKLFSVVLFLLCGSTVLASTSDPRVTVSRADLDYTQPASRSEEGMPVGNGRMGSLVWTTPSALKLQINRVDVFAMHASSVSFPRADSDYAAGCGYVYLNLSSAGDDVFSGDAFHQHLSVYNGLMTAQGQGITARVVAWPARDVMAIEIDDQRAQPEPVNVDLRMLRYESQFIPGKNFALTQEHAVEVHTVEHTARSRLDIRGDRILLSQQFSERDYYDASAVAIAALGRPARARYLNESTVQLSVPAGRGKFTLLISSAATFDAKQDVGALALAELDAAVPRNFAGLLADTAAWWRDFWSRGHVTLHSADGQADFVGENYTYFLYLMGASSRGKYPPRFGGLLWRTTGDLSRWGSQFWWANTSAYYRNLMPAGRLDLMDPMFDMYSGMRDSCALAARQQWGSQGHWIPEIVFFDGLEKLPDDIATELRELMLVRKPYEQRSAAFQAFAEVRNRHHARWNFQADGEWVDGHYVVPTKGHGIFGHCTHILGAGARIADLFWQRYQYTMDEAWLRDRAYPMIKGMAEFYRNFPNFKKEADGKYHIRNINNGESHSEWGSADSVYETYCMNLIFPLAIRASEILDVDADLRVDWAEIKANLVSTQVSARIPGTSTAGGFGAFVYGGAGAIAPLGSEPEMKTRFLNFNRLASFIDEPGIGGAQIFRNRLRLREGPGAIDAEHLGGLASGVHETLLNSAPPSEEGEPVLRLFSSWPKEWDADFTLLARGGFTVSAAQTGGKVGSVEIVSHAGAICRLQNPWRDAEVRLTRDGRTAETLQGVQLTFPTKAGERIAVALAD